MRNLKLQKTPLSIAVHAAILSLIGVSFQSSANDTKAAIKQTVIEGIAYTDENGNSGFKVKIAKDDGSQYEGWDSSTGIFSQALNITANPISSGNLSYNVIDLSGVTIKIAVSGTVPENSSVSKNDDYYNYRWAKNPSINVGFYGANNKDNGTADNNTVTFSKVNISNFDLGVADSSGVYEWVNKVDYEIGAFSIEVYGGSGDKGASNNTVNISDSLFIANRVAIVPKLLPQSGNYNNAKSSPSISIVGGDSSHGGASGNTVSIKNSTFIAFDDGRNINKQVNTDDPFKNDVGIVSVYGGYGSRYLSESNNTVESGSQDVLESSNTVEISGSSFSAARIAGGFQRDDDSGSRKYGIVYNNTVKISDSIFGNVSASDGYNAGIMGSSAIYGGYGYGDVSNNTLTIESSSFNHNATIISGGYSIYGEAKENKVKIKDSSFFSTKTGNSESQNFIYGGYSKLGIADSNIVDISGTTYFAGKTTIAGGYTTSHNGNELSSNNNVVNLRGNPSFGSNGDSYLTDICGGYILITNEFITNESEKSISVANNSINLSGTLDLSKVDLYGGYITLAPDVNYDYSNASIVDNALNIGYYIDPDTKQPVYDAWNGSSTVNSLNYFSDINFYKVLWDTGTTSLKIAKTYSLASTNISLSNLSFDCEKAKTDDYTIFALSDSDSKPLSMNLLSGVSDLTSDKIDTKTGKWSYSLANGGATVSGSWSVDDSSYDTDTLSVSLTSVDSISFNSGISWVTDGTILTLADGFTSEELSKITVDTTNIAFTADSLSTISSAGSYKMTLIDTNGLSGFQSSNIKSASSEFTVGTTLIGSGVTSIDDSGDVIYSLDTREGLTVQEQTHDVAIPDPPPRRCGPGCLTVQKQTHDVAMAQAAAATALNAGSNNAVMAFSNLASSGVSGLQSFSAVGGSTSRTETGSHVTTNTVNLTVGLGSNTYFDDGFLTTGAFFETGYGKFHNSYDAGAAEPYIKKNGHVAYTGAGITAGYTFNNGWHVDSMVRGGVVKTSQKDALYDFSTKSKYNVNIDTFYVGAELGGGYIYKFNDTHAIDFYARYMYLFQGGDDFEAGGKYELESINSHRVRAGAEYLYNINKNSFLHAGLGYEYEFDGKAVTKASGFEAEPARMKGGRAMASFGYKYSPEKSGFEYDAAVKTAYGSKYRSAYIDLNIKYKF